jgi:hypothetical protein
MKSDAIRVSEVLSSRLGRREGADSLGGLLARVLDPGLDVVLVCASVSKD